MACERNEGCICPNTACARHGHCCLCVKAHRSVNDLTYCMKHNEDGSTRLEDLYKKMSTKFGNK